MASDVDDQYDRDGVRTIIRIRIFAIVGDARTPEHADVALLTKFNHSFRSAHLLSCAAGLQLLGQSSRKFFNRIVLQKPRFISGSGVLAPLHNQFT